MYFVIIAAFAILLSDGLPPPDWNVLDHVVRRFALSGGAGTAPLFINLLQIPMAAIDAYIVSRRTLRARDGTPAGEARSEDHYATGSLVLAGVLFGGLMVCFLFSGWLDLVRRQWELARW